MAHLTLLRTDTQNLPSDWLCQHAHRIKASGQVLDVAAGSGRNARWLAWQGFNVEAVDRDAMALRSMAGVENIHTYLADIEQANWPYAGRQFDAVVVCRYLYRPLLNTLIDTLAVGGVLIYETFMRGNEAYGRPANPDFLLQADELLTLCHAQFEIIDFVQGYRETPKPAMMQSICAIKQ